MGCTKYWFVCVCFHCGIMLSFPTSSRLNLLSSLLGAHNLLANTNSSSCCVCVCVCVCAFVCLRFGAVVCYLLDAIMRSCPFISALLSTTSALRPRCQWYWYVMGDIRLTCAELGGIAFQRLRWKRRDTTSKFCRASFAGPVYDPRRDTCLKCCVSWSNGHPESSCNTISHLVCKNWSRSALAVENSSYCAVRRCTASEVSLSEGWLLIWLRSNGMLMLRGWWK